MRFLSSYKATFAIQDQAIGTYNVLTGVHILPRAIWKDPERRNATLTVVKKIVEKHGTFGGYHQHPNGPQNIRNSVNPPFRDEVSLLVLGTQVAENATPEELHEASQTLTFDVIGPLRALSPEGGAYANEVDVNERDWQVSFWGDNYPKLLKLKKRFDPRGLFYVSFMFIMVLVVRSGKLEMVRRAFRLRMGGCVGFDWTFVSLGICRYL